MKRTIIELITGTVFTGGAVAAQTAKGMFSLNDPVNIFSFVMSGADWLTLVSFGIGFFSFGLVIVNQVKKLKK